MGIESKPLFHPEVLRQQVRAFKAPERIAAYQPRLQPWASLIASGRADELKETELLPDFITDIFCASLGYTGPAGPGNPFGRPFGGRGARRAEPAQPLAPSQRNRMVSVNDEDHPLCRRPLCLWN